MKIVDVANQPVQAAAQFAYKGWTISMSTIFKNVDVYAWNGVHNIEFKGHTVEYVINQIADYEANN